MLCQAMLTNVMLVCCARLCSLTSDNVLYICLSIQKYSKTDLTNLNQLDRDVRKVPSIDSEVEEVTVDHYAAIGHSIPQGEDGNMMIRDTGLHYATTVGFRSNVSHYIL